MAAKPLLVDGGYTITVNPGGDVFRIDPLVCPQCAGPLRGLANLNSVVFAHAATVKFRMMPRANYEPSLDRGEV